MIDSGEGGGTVVKINMQQRASVLPVAGVAVRTAAPYAGIAAVRACSAPSTAGHGTTMSSAARRSLVAYPKRDWAVDAAARTDVPGSPPRQAPV
jgi:hypothetical protein